MSSKIVYQFYNYSASTILSTQVIGDKHIENNGDSLNNITLPPVKRANSDDYVSSTITVTTGDHDGSLTLNFYDVNSPTSTCATLECTDLKNPEEPGVLKCSANHDFILKAAGYRSVNNARLIKVTLKDSETESILI